MHVEPWSTWVAAAEDHLSAKDWKQVPSRSQAILKLGSWTWQWFSLYFILHCLYSHQNLFESCWRLRFFAEVPILLGWTPVYLLNAITACTWLNSRVTYWHPAEGNKLFFDRLLLSKQQYSGRNWCTLVKQEEPPSNALSREGPKNLKQKTVTMPNPLGSTLCCSVFNTPPVSGYDLESYSGFTWDSQAALTPGLTALFCISFSSWSQELWQTI